MLKETSHDDPPPTGSVHSQGVPARQRPSARARLSQEINFYAPARRQEFSEKYADLIRGYHGRPIDVSFRELAGPIAGVDPGHSMHPYPAKLLRHIPYFLLGCEQLVDSNTTVLDPFCGSGTVLDEGRRWGAHVIGRDCNPLAVLISQVRTGSSSAEMRLESLNLVIRHAQTQSTSSHEYDNGLEYWIGSETLAALSRLRNAIPEADNDITRFLRLALSLTADHLACKDRRLPVPVRPKDQVPSQVDEANVFGHFISAGEKLSARLCGLDLYQSDRRANVSLGDARNSLGVENQDGLLVFTSPPYGAAQKYARASGISLQVVYGHTPASLRNIDNASVGRERVRPQSKCQCGRVEPQTGTQLRSVLASIEANSLVRANIYAEYFHDMRHFIDETTRTLSVDQQMVLATSGNTVAGGEVNTHAVLQEIAAEAGLKTELILQDKILARSFITKRASSASQPIRHEFVYVFRKAS